MYLSASESVNVIRPQGIRAGRLFAPKPIRTLGGIKHAYREGDSVTVCGRELEALHLWPEIPFGNLGQHCSECAKVTGVFDGA